MADLKKELERGVLGAEKPPVPALEKSSKPGENLEVESWMEKIERKFARVPNKTQDVTDDTVVVQSPKAQQPPVTLPVNQQQMQAGKRAKTDSGIAWLVTWVIRQIKLLTKLGRKVRLQDLPEAK